MEKYLKPITKDTHKKIMEYLDNSIYKIKGNDDKYGIGFFCKIKCHNKIIPVLITNYNIINERYYSNNNSIKVLINNELIPIEFCLINYLNKDLDLSIIEIKENKFINLLDIDANIYKEESEIYFNKESIYIIHNAYNNNCVSYGIINYINNEEIIISCNINSDSNFYPIFNLNTNKLVGIFKNNSNYYSKGINFKYIINKLKPLYIKNDIDIINKKNINNEIDIRIKIYKKDIGHKIYFLDNEYKEEEMYYSLHDNLMELNELNTELYINGKKENYKKYFIPDNNNTYNIKIKFSINLTDCSYMFTGCENITDIDFISFNTQYIKNMKYMFYGCKKLKNVNLLCFNTKNIIDMSHMFELCENLKYLDLSSFIIKDKINNNYMFYESYIFNNIEHLNNLDFKELKELDFSLRQISDIKVLEEVNFIKLQTLNLSSNKISDIKVLENVNFKKLLVLDLNDNNISDIKVLEKVNFKELQTLDLSYNEISDIKVLEKVNFKELQTLDLNYNEISDIKVLENVNFKELRKLDLSNNLITDIKVLKKVNFKKLKELNLINNDINN